MNWTPFSKEMNWTSLSVTVGGACCSLWLLRKLLRRSRRCTSRHEISGKTVIITGATSGVGKALAIELAKLKAKTLILACRNVPLARETAAEIRSLTGTGSSRSGVTEVKVMELDLSSFASIRAFCDCVLEEEVRIDVLVNNAGVFNCPLAWTEDGLEMQMGVNHFGHFLLTQLLLDRIRATDGSRIVVVSSHFYTKGKLDYSDINWRRRPYKGPQAYSDSKLANSLFAWELNRRLKQEESQVTVLALTPGMVATSITRHTLPALLVTALDTLGVALGIRDPWEGCQSALYCCVEPSLARHSGAYVDSDCRITRWDTRVTDGAHAGRLWDVSERITKTGQYRNA